MGAEQSDIISGQLKDNFGYRVVGIKPEGPAATAGIEPFLDFIIFTKLMQGDKQLLLSEYLNLNQGKQVVLRVYNIITQSVRLVPVELPACDEEQSS